MKFILSSLGQKKGVFHLRGKNSSVLETALFGNVTYCLEHPALLNVVMNLRVPLKGWKFLIYC